MNKDVLNPVPGSEPTTHAFSIRAAVDEILLTPGRENVLVRFDDGRSYAGPIGAPVEAFVCRAVQDRPLPNQAEAVAVLLNGRLNELSVPVSWDVQARIVDTGQRDGARIYRRSLTLLLLAAVHRTFPGTTISVDHVLDSGGYYCVVDNRAPFTEDELKTIQNEMKALVAADLPITKERIPIEEAQIYFQENGDRSKVELLAHRRKDELALYTLDGITNYFHGYMVPSSGYLSWFGLVLYGEGFVVRFPRRDAPATLQPVDNDTVLSPIFQEYTQWMRSLNLRHLGSLNNAVMDQRISEVILISEALHERRISAVAGTIASTWNGGGRSGFNGRGGGALARANEDELARKQVQAVFIAGPSSSGKTTFSKRLGIQLLANGLRPYALSLDNFFVDRDRTPRGEDGDFDFEALEAVDLDLFGHCLDSLLQGKKTDLPNYNFVTGKREAGETVQLGPDQILIVEGIHGLNPRLTSHVDQAKLFKVFISVLTHLNLDRHNRLPPSDVRLLRRIVRDHGHRGYTATDTLLRWDRVRQGEEKWILPFKIHADAIFNSALLYEVSVLRPLVEPLLLQIDRDIPVYTEARRLLAFLQWVSPSDPDLVPDNSILREFVGGSILRHFSMFQEQFE